MDTVIQADQIAIRRDLTLWRGNCVVWLKENDSEGRKGAAKDRSDRIRKWREMNMCAQRSCNGM